MRLIRFWLEALVYTFSSTSDIEERNGEAFYNISLGDVGGWREEW